MKQRIFYVLTIVLMILVIVVPSAYAASILLQKKSRANAFLGASTNPVDITLDDGLRVEFRGVFLIDGRSISAFVVTPPKDMILEVNTENAFDSHGNQFAHEMIMIGNEVTQKREIIADSRVIVIMGHKGFEESKEVTFARLRFWFNGKELTFRDVIGKLTKDYNEIFEEIE